MPTLTAKPVRFATSDSVGDYVLVGLPAGHWNVLAEHTGFATAPQAGTIPAPGDTTALPDFVLHAVSP